MQRVIGALRRSSQALAHRLNRRRIVLNSGSYVANRFAANRLGRFHQGYEPGLDRVLSSVFAIDDGAFLDVGANVGQTFLRVLGLDKDRAYFGFEPQVAAAAAIERFIHMNRLTKHAVLPVALWNQRAILPLGRKSLTSVTASLVDEFRPQGYHAQHHYVVALPGDEIISKLGLRTIAAIKIDTEGSELEVLEGLDETLRSVQPFVIFEVLPNYLAISRTPLDAAAIAFREPRLRRLEAFLFDHRYAIYQITGQDRLVPVDRFSPPTDVAEHWSSNFVAAPTARQESFMARFAGG